MSISLSKNQPLSLVKQDGSHLTKVLLGLGWDEAPRKRGLFGGGGGDIDLDASAILLDQNKQLADIVFFGQLQSKDGSVRHTGDNLTGAGSGDDEQIIVDLSAVHASVQTIVLVITSYRGQTFDKVQNVFARVADISASPQGPEAARYNLQDAGNRTGQVIAKIARDGAGWAVTALGVSADGKTAKDLVAAAQAVA